MPLENLLALFAKRDPEHQRRTAILAKTTLFAGIKRRLLGRLATHLFDKTYAPGEVIFREGDPGRALFIVAKGSVEVLRSTPEGERRVALFEENSAFGELALLDEQPRSATARAIAQSELLILYRTHFDGLLEGDKDVALALTRNLMKAVARYVRAKGGAYPPVAAKPPASGPGTP